MSDTRRLERLGSAIKDARGAKGLKLRHVSLALGIPLRTVHAWEQGENHIPALRLVELADFLAIDLGRLARQRGLHRAA